MSEGSGVEPMEAGRAEAEAWWRTGIIEMRPGVIRYRGYAIENLIGRVSFAGMIWLMLRGELPSEGQTKPTLEQQKGRRVPINIDVLVNGFLA